MAKRTKQEQEAYLRELRERPASSLEKVRAMIHIPRTSAEECQIANLESGFARMAAREWKENRPKLWKALLRRGELAEALKEAGRQADEYMEKAQQQGMDYHQAEEVALRTWILLPDVD